MTAGSSTRRHIVGLDAWRAALMLGGVLLHGASGLPTTGLFGAIDLISQTFRMGAFYGIAGVLSALVLADRSPEMWLRRRVFQLGFPLAFGMAIISPAICLMAATLGWPQLPLPVPFEWHHLWFLAGLILYSATAYCLVRSGFETAARTWLERLLESGRLRPTTVLLAVAVAMALLFGIAPVVMSATLSTPLFGAFRTLQLIAGYLPMFLFGYCVGRSPAVCAAMLDRWRVALVIVAAVATAYLLWFLAVAPELDPAAATAGTYRLRFLGAAICPPAAFVLILRSALSIRRVPALVARISQAAYTIYLLHLPIAVAINLSLRPLMLDPHASYAIAVVGSALSSFYFHEYWVRRSALLALLLNGKPLYRPIPRSA